MADAPKTKYEPPKELESRAAVQKFMGRAKRNPANQAEFFYNIRITHIVFFVSSLLMLAAFGGMFYKDHVKEWKEYQSEFAAIEFERLISEIKELNKAQEEHDAKLAIVDQKIADFIANFPDDDEGREVTVTVDGEPVTVHVIGKRKERELAIREQAEIAGALYDRQMLFNFAKDEMGAVRFRYEEARHHLDEAREKQSERLPSLEHHYDVEKKAWEAVKEKVRKTKADFDEVNILNERYQAALDAIKKATKLAGVWEGESFSSLEKRREDLVQDLEAKLRRFDSENPASPTHAIRNAPGLNFFKPTLKVEQVILKDVLDQLNFTKVPKVDRCHTCHVGIKNPLYAVTIDPEATEEAERYRFTDSFLAKFVAHARGKVDDDACEICDRDLGKNLDGDPIEVPAPLTEHGSWGTDETVKFTKALMAHPKLELYVSDSSKHPLATFGCTVCHDGDGRDTDFTRVVHIPDTHEEGKAWRRRHGTPYGEERYNWNYRELWLYPMIQTKFLQSSCRRCHDSAVELDGAEKYVEGMKLVERAGCYGCHRMDSYQILEKDLKNPAIDINSKSRRPGPPLQKIATKTTPAWAKKWVSAPRGYRPTTKMPHFFGQSNMRTRVRGHEYPVDKGRSPVDDAIVSGLVEYVWSLSETKGEAAPKGKGDAKKGEAIVRQVGCTACHTLEDETYGPDRSRFLEEFAPSLAGIGSKVDRTWLYHWVRDPKKYFPDTRMPDLRLTEQEALDVVEYLMTLKKPEWENLPVPAADSKVVDDLLLEMIEKKTPVAMAEAELAAIGKKPGGKLRELGRRMVANYGCYSCHELKADGDDVWQEKEGIGVELTGSQPFGSKHADRLDFGFAMDDGVNHKGVDFEHPLTGEEIKAHVHETRQAWLLAKLQNPRVFDGGKMASKPFDELLRMPNFALTEYERERIATFILSFTNHKVAGLLDKVQKVLSPDEKAMERGNRIVRESNCRACHRLALDRYEMKWTRMVKEKGKDKKKTTFEWVEGLNKGTLDGAKAEPVLKKWGLVGEETPDAEKKKMRVDLVAWVVDHRTMRMPGVVNPNAQQVAYDGERWWYLVADAEGNPARVEIRRHEEMDGGTAIPKFLAEKVKLNDAHKKYLAGLEEKYAEVEGAVDKAKDPKKKEALEAELDRLGELLDNTPPNLIDPTTLEAHKPPMLRTQGVKTQVPWLFDFLKQPYMIRPNYQPIKPGAVAMPGVGVRMPTFGFTDEEAGSLAHWFAVRDHLPGVDHYPNTTIREHDQAVLAAGRDVRDKVVPLIKRDCAKCHVWDGAMPPGPSSQAHKFAPEFGKMGERLRPRWLHTWLANPASVYPGTTMTNYTYPPEIGQEKGAQAAIELIMNFDDLKPKD